MLLRPANNLVARVRTRARRFKKHLCTVTATCVLSARQQKLAEPNIPLVRLFTILSARSSLSTVLLILAIIFRLINTARMQPDHLTGKFLPLVYIYIYVYIYLIELANDCI